MKIAYIDTETTGLDPKRCGIHHIGGIIEIDGARVDSFDWHVQPFPDDHIEKEAMDVSGVTPAIVTTYAQPVAVYKSLTTTLAKYVNKFDKQDKFHFVAYNAGFDSDFMRAWFQKNGDSYYGSWFWTPHICVMTLAGAALMKERHKLPNFKLATVAAHFGVTVDQTQTHDAGYDVALARAIYLHITTKEPALL